MDLGQGFGALKLDRSSCHVVSCQLSSGPSVTTALSHRLREDGDVLPSHFIRQGRSIVNGFDKLEAIF